MLRTIREILTVVAGAIASVFVLANLDDPPPEIDRETKPPHKEEEEKGDD